MLYDDQYVLYYQRVQCVLCCFFFKQKTAYEMRISDWSSDVCSSDLWRQEYFVERDVLETRSGRDGRHATLAGAAFDIPLDARGQQVTLLAGVQEFSGDNVRTQLRAVYSLQLVADWGLGMQLRARSFHNSHPRELDYYSQRRFDEIG